MSAKAEQILEAMVAVLATVTPLQGRVYEHDPSNPPSIATTPVAIIRFDAVSRETGTRERSLGIDVDVLAERQYYASAGLGPQRALLRLQRDIEVAMHGARYTSPILNHCEFVGAQRITEDDGQTRNGVTLSWRITFTEAALG